MFLTSKGKGAYIFRKIILKYCDNNVKTCDTNHNKLITNVVNFNKSIFVDNLYLHIQFSWKNHYPKRIKFQ